MANLTGVSVFKLTFRQDWAGKQRVYPIWEEALESVNEKNKMNKMW